MLGYVCKHEDHLVTTKQLCLEFKEIEEGIFPPRVEKDITIPPMKEYIQDLLKISLTKIVNTK